MDEALGTERTARLRESLSAALYVRGLPEMSGDDLDRLGKAVGTFTGLADYLRV